jgi:riboflavin kinase
MHTEFGTLMSTPGGAIGMAATAGSAVGHNELATLKILALDEGLDGGAKTSCTALADRLDASNQTASRRLQTLEDAGLIERERVADGQWVGITAAGERALRREYAEYRRLFESSAGVELSGTVTVGMGEGRHYITLPGYMAQFAERLGYEPFPGTLNVDLSPESIRARAGFETLRPVHIDGWENDERTYGPAVCYPATVVADRDSGSDHSSETESSPDLAADDEPVETGTYGNAHVIAPERTHHDEDQLELIAPDKLRDELSLADGDSVTIRVGGR